jgi:hypothetical protein
MGRFCRLLNNHRALARRCLSAQRSHPPERHNAHSVKWAAQHRAHRRARIGEREPRPPVGGVAQAPGSPGRAIQYRYSPRRIASSTLAKFRVGVQPATHSGGMVRGGGHEVVPVGKIRAEKHELAGADRGVQRLHVSRCEHPMCCYPSCRCKVPLPSGPIDRGVPPAAPRPGKAWVAVPVSRREKAWVACLACPNPDNCWNRGCWRESAPGERVELVPWHLPPPPVTQPRECRNYPRCGCDFDGECFE